MCPVSWGGARLPCNGLCLIAGSFRVITRIAEGNLSSSAAFASLLHVCLQNIVLSLLGMNTEPLHCVWTLEMCAPETRKLVQCPTMPLWTLTSVEWWEVHSPPTAECPSAFSLLSLAHAAKRSGPSCFVPFSQPPACIETTNLQQRLTQSPAFQVELPHCITTTHHPIIQPSLLHPPRADCQIPRPKHTPFLSVPQVVPSTNSRQPSPLLHMGPPMLLM
eukprot:GGOE01030339.1.p1 GENE.GGOE01030339.1~~GGOE01030339.1.p1  ORF type:complete len:219 (+),score=9.76 GGOE01030339.1:174-830(+)